MDTAQDGAATTVPDDGDAKHTNANVDAIAEDENTSESQQVEAAASPGDDDDDDGGAFKDALDTVPDDDDAAKSDANAVEDAHGKDGTEVPTGAETAAASPAKPMEVDEPTDEDKQLDATVASSVGDGDQEVDRPEEVDMESMDETMDKDKSVSEDPFDQLKQSTTTTVAKSVSTTASEKNRNDDSDDDDDNAADDAAPAAGDEDNEADDASPNATLLAADEHDNDDADGVADTTPAASEAGGDEASAVDNDQIDDIEQGKGVDEEVSLLPDAEREISDADKERAIQAVADDKETADDAGHDATASADDDSAATGAATTESTAEAAADAAEQAIAANDAADAAEAASEKAADAAANAEAPGENEIRELSVGTAEEPTCAQCKLAKPCYYVFLLDSDTQHLCTGDCVRDFRAANAAYKLIGRRQTIILIADVEQTCAECADRKTCKYRLRHSVDGTVRTVHWCDDACLQLYTEAHPEASVRRARHVIDEIVETPSPQPCIQCSEQRPCRFSFTQSTESPAGEEPDAAATDATDAADAVLFVCNEDCLNLLLKEQPDRFRVKRRSVRVRDLPKRAGYGSATIATDTADAAPEPVKMVARTDEEAERARLDREASFVRRCGQCCAELVPGERTLHWEALDFCNETCLGVFQNVIGGTCTTCHSEVTMTSLGKYCVRFGYEIRQFCRAQCLDEFKKGLKLCSFCQTDISKGDRGFLASVGGQFKDFCQPSCMRRYDEMCNAKRKLTSGLCAVCNNADVVQVEVNVAGQTHKFCSNPCFSAFQFVNNINADKCEMCAKYFERQSADAHTIYDTDAARAALLFCSKVCQNIYIITHRKIVPCQWCKVKKYNFDMIQKNSVQGSSATGVNSSGVVQLCSLNCLTLCEVSLNAISMKKQPCDQCASLAMPQYHLTMSDSSIRNFCTYQCVMSFQSQFSRTPLTLEGETPPAAGGAAGAAGRIGGGGALSNSPVPAGLPKRIKNKSTTAAMLAAASAANKTLPTATSATTTLANSGAAGAKGKLSAKLTSRMLASSKVPIISSVTSLAGGMRTRKGNNSTSNVGTTGIDLEPPLPGRQTYGRKSQGSGGGGAAGTARNSTAAPPAPPAPPIIKTQIVTLPPVPKRVQNMSTSCRPVQRSREVQCQPTTATIGCQTDAGLERTIFIPIPVPIYIPQPMHMYSLPTPIPVPIPLPIPVPVFIPTTRNSASGIMKEITKIQDKMPTDPYEAELLMMAEMVAGVKKKNDSDSGSDDDADDGGAGGVAYAVNERAGGGGASAAAPAAGGAAHAALNDGAALGDDVLQMALKMAQDYDVPAVDLESAMTANTITPGTHPHLQFDGDINDPTALQHHHLLVMEHQRQMAAAAAVAAAAQPGGRGRKRAAAGAGGRNARGGQAQQQQQQIQTQQAITPPNSKRSRRLDGNAMIASPVQQQQQQQMQQPEAPREPAEKADANMCLKFTFGVNAWKQWVMTKNAELEKSSIRRKPFNSELLQLTADELNYSLCLFVREVRKPNGSEYAPDTIYYLVLGIQQYLYENGRIDNIFTDPYYEKFTDCLDDVAKKFSVLYNDSQYIVTRVEEEHLWECKQLGAHSPHVLLSTLMFFNTKHFNLTTVEEHMQLSFSHIMKHWKRNPNQVGAVKTPGSRNVLLRFYPPQASLDGNSRKKKVYEQQENEENPLRCPVKLYEFYLSKCPESVKTRNDVFYLQPERSCVPDSPVWYSTQALGKDSLCKMLHRVKMVKEINIALLTS